MELKKTTILSAFVVVAGVIAEIIFRDVLSKSIAGVVISLVLAVIIFVSFYFTIDGMYSLWNKEREQEKKHRKEVEQRLYTILNEQLKFQKIIYNEVHRLVQAGGVQTEKSGNVDTQPVAIDPLISEESIDKIVAAVNDHTTKVTQELEAMVTDMSDQTADAIKNMENAVASINDHTTETAEGLSSMVASVNEHVAETAEGLRSMAASINEHTTETAEGLSSMVASVNEHVAETAEGLSSMAASINEHTTDVVNDLGNMVAEVQAKTEETAQNTADIADTMQSQPVAQLTAEPVQDLGSIAAGINDHTMNTAKVVVKYIGKTSEEIKKKLEENQQSLLNVVGS